MSYLEMASAPIPDMQKGIIAFWFRAIKEQQPEPPEAVAPDGMVSNSEIENNWPTGDLTVDKPLTPGQPLLRTAVSGALNGTNFWSKGSASTCMIPPNVQASIYGDPDFENKTVYWNSYGMPTGGAFFGDLFMGPAAVWIPNAPPLALNSLNSSLNPPSKTAGIRTLLTFGDPNIAYEYASWRVEKAGVIPAVIYIAQVILGPEYVVTDYPPPYNPYYLKIGDHGKFFPQIFRTNPPQSKGGVIPQSFFGIDMNGYLIIYLQTKTKAQYKGMAFEQSNIKELWACHSILQITGPPYSYSQVGFPFPDGVWYQICGYWNGYEFEYTDISDKVMGCCPESFLISAVPSFFTFPNGPRNLDDGKWHQVVFSFDIGGAAHMDQPSAPIDPETGVVGDTPPPNFSTNCKAWLAVDDHNYTGDNLQCRPLCHDGLTLPKLPGTKTTQILDCGPVTTFVRGGMGDNDILPRNMWLRGWAGNPKDGLTIYAANTQIVDGTPGPFDSASRAALKYADSKDGDFNPFDWISLIWPLYGHGIAPGDWIAKLTPEHFTVQDPKTFDVPTYDCSGFTIPVNGHPIGVPASSHHLKHNTGVEMAELQIWANQSLDTSLVSNRRLFITEDGKPEQMKAAEKVLGKPDVKLHGSGAWKQGRNTGTSGIDKEGNLKPDGQFQPTAAIERFQPDPKLGK